VSAKANTTAAPSLKALDQAGFYQQPVETPSLDATRAAVRTPENCIHQAIMF
jgi:hypothetical protein